MCISIMNIVNSIYIVILIIIIMIMTIFIIIGINIIIIIMMMIVVGGPGPILERLETNTEVRACERTPLQLEIRDSWAPKGTNT